VEEQGVGDHFAVGLADDGFAGRMGAEILPDWRISRVTGEPLTALAQP
jgi:hypothetical protein